MKAPSKNNPLSSTMLAALRAARANGGKLVRLPGGFWMAGGGCSFGTTTIQSLVMRGYMQYTDWKDGRHGNFPIEATITEEAP